MQFRENRKKISQYLGRRTMEFGINNGFCLHFVCCAHCIMGKMAQYAVAERNCNRFKTSGEEEK